MPGRFWLCHRDRACAETALRAAAILVRPGEATVILGHSDIPFKLVGGLGSRLSLPTIIILSHFY